MSNLGARHRRRRRSQLGGGPGSGPKGMHCTRFGKGKGGRRVCRKFGKGRRTKRTTKRK